MICCIDYCRVASTNAGRDRQKVVREQGVLAAACDALTVRRRCSCSRMGQSHTSYSFVQLDLIVRFVLMSCAQAAFRGPYDLNTLHEKSAIFVLAELAYKFVEHAFDGVRCANVSCPPCVRSARAPAAHSFCCCRTCAIVSIQTHCAR